MSLDQRLKYEPRMGSVHSASNWPFVAMIGSAALGIAGALLALQHAF
jgi:hypothetical protein